MSDDKSHFQKFGWILTSNHLELLSEAQVAIQIVESDTDVRKVEISGKYQQINCLDKKAEPALRRWATHFHKKWESEVKKVMEQIGVSPSEIVNGNLQHLKLLIAPPHSSLRQSAHRDGLSKFAYVVALYLTNHDSTHFSIHPYLFQDLKTLTREEMQQIDPRYWTEFISKRCSPGDMSIFHEDVTHFGGMNLTSRPRYVLFSVFKPKTMKLHRDYVQHYQWDWVENTTSFGSQEHRDALWANLERRPDAHYSGIKRKRLRALMNNEKRKRKGNHHRK